jgi:hypothetical protein
MSVATLRELVTDYLRVRRSLGYKLSTCDPVARTS